MPTSKSGSLKELPLRTGQRQAILRCASALGVTGASLQLIDLALAKGQICPSARLRAQKARGHDVHRVRSYPCGHWLVGRRRQPKASRPAVGRRSPAATPCTPHSHRTRAPLALPTRIAAIALSCDLLRICVPTIGHNALELLVRVLATITHELRKFRFEKSVGGQIVDLT